MAIYPSPVPSGSFVDPFYPLPEDIPPAPGWLLPTVLVIFFAAALSIAVLLVMWGVARRKSAAVLAAGRATTAERVNLRDFDPRADPRRPKSPKVVREDDINRHEDEET